MIKPKKVIFFLPSLLSLSLLFSCGQEEENTENYNGEITYSFKEGKAEFRFEGEDYKEFNLYKKGHNENEYKLLEKLSSPFFSNEDIRASFKIVPLVNGSEKRSYTILVKPYVEGVFGNSNVKVFFPDDDHDEIQQFIDNKYATLCSDEWSEDRVEVLFMPGFYTDITLKNGYYTSFRGLGASPDDCIFSSMQTINHPRTGNALINFWRSAENLSFYRNSTWAISQATSLRRTHFRGDLALFDLKGGNGLSSGGFIANSLIDGTINPGTQQQFLMRNDTFASFNHSNMNMVFEGTVGETPKGTWIESRTTLMETSLDVIEKPFLVYDETKGFGYYVPTTLNKNKGHDFSLDDHDFVPLSEFAVMNPNDNAKKINEKLKQNKYILFTPGTYSLDETLEVVQDGSFIMGLGYATLSANGTQKKIMSVKSIDNHMSSLLFQSEGKTENYLVLEEADNSSRSTLSDLFFRVGGHTSKDVNVDTCLIINQDNVIGDNFWIWRADHGKNIGYKKNYGKYGCVINGQHVVCHALMIEHFYKYQLIWNGEYGEVIFYQSETPYDLPSPTYWSRVDEGYEGETAMGYPSYKISDNVINHKAHGIGIYFINTSGIEELVYTALETPCNEGIDLEHVSARYFGGEGRFLHTINDIKGYEEDLNMTIESFNKETYPDSF